MAATTDIGPLGASAALDEHTFVPRQPKTLDEAPFVFLPCGNGAHF